MGEGVKDGAHKVRVRELCRKGPKREGKGMEERV